MLFKKKLSDRYIFTKEEIRMINGQSHKSEKTSVLEMKVKKKIQREKKHVYVKKLRATLKNYHERV